jgi:acetyl esterase/lipase
MKTIARILGVSSALAAGLLYVRIKCPIGRINGSVWLLRLLAEATTPAIALGGATAAALALLVQSPLALVTGIFAAVIAVRDVFEVTGEQPGLAAAFGANWEGSIPLECQARMLHRRWSWKLPAEPEPRWQRDLPFWTLADSGRSLLCDLWQPPEGTASSGLAIVYLHGSAWYLLDKDLGTRTLFRHLAAQGHLVMDVAYRLYPETDMFGMVHDTKRAIAWMKSRAPGYEVDQGRIVLAGGSAGGHLALLAAYTPTLVPLNPDDVEDVDFSVRAVISCYGPNDLRAYYEHTRQNLWRHSNKAAKPAPVNPAMRRALGASYERLGFGKPGPAGAIEPMLGGTPETVPELYALFSPISHVHPDSPPTLLIQGKDDVITPLAGTNHLYERLVAAGVPAVNVVFPHAEHGFDLTLPCCSPAAQTAMYYEDRFLALMQ